MTEIGEERVSRLWKLYEDGIAYQEQIGLRESVKQNVDFYEGRQWKAPQKDVYFPRPQANIVKKIVRNKRANILGTPVALNYESADNSDAANVFNDMARFVGKEMNLEMLDTRALLDGAVKGTYIYHFFWDNEARGVYGRIEGGVRGEIIDVTNLFVANPNEPDIQRQEWIMIASRVQVSAARAMADHTAFKELITADEKSASYSQDTEQNSVEYCTVLTRYFRKNGEVYFEKAVKGTMLHEPLPINPFLVRTDGISEDEANEGTPDIVSDDALDGNTATAWIYPIALGVWDERDGVIYGESEVSAIVPNQKIINFTLSMYALLVQNAGTGKYIVLPEALKGQLISNKPGQVLIDHTKTGNGIRRLQEPPPDNSSLVFADKLIDMTQAITGASEVLNGELPTNMSGIAIVSLQQQAQKPIIEMQRRFWRVREDIGRIFEQFFKLYYDRKEYTYEERREGDENITQKAVFEADRYRATSLSCAVQAGAGSMYSETMAIAMLDNLFAKGAITAKDYVARYPKTANPDRAELIKVLEEQEQSQLQQLMEQIQQLQLQISEQAQYIQSKQAIFESCDSLLRENETLKTQLLAMHNRFNALTAEYTEKINIANAYLMENQIIKGGGENSGMPEMRTVAQAGESGSGQAEIQMQ